jgi:lipopolysaccharide transport system ATP-binding protein
MHVRLAFAVAAHLDTEILLVDEVLAVGDAKFQKKCVGKISQAAQSGRTVLFVSHNMAPVSTLCSRAILLGGGVTVMAGPTRDVIAAYLEANENRSGEVTWEAADRNVDNGRIRLAKARIVSSRGVTADVEIDEPFTLEIDFEVARPLNVCSSIHVMDKQGSWAFCSGTNSRPLRPNWYRESYEFPANLLNDGLYSITVFLLTDTTHVEIRIEHAIAFTVHETNGRGEYLGTIGGCVRPQLEVSHTCLSEVEEGRNEDGDSVLRIGHSLARRD